MITGKSAAGKCRRLLPLGKEINMIYQTKYLKYEISPQGQNICFSSSVTGQNRVRTGPCAAIVKEDHSQIFAVAAEEKEGLLHITFEDGTKADVQVEEKSTYLTFTLRGVSREDFLAIAFVNIELDDAPKNFYGTLIGMTLATRMEEHPGDNRVLRAEAFPKIGLLSTDRSSYPAKAAVIGSSWEELRGIERVVLDEIPDSELPKSNKGGPYADVGREQAMGNYTIFTETVTLDNVENVIMQMKRFGISQINLHHYGHYVQGDFQCLDRIPGGFTEFKQVIDRFHAEGMLVGLQTYAFFVTPNSRYVTPVPHKDLDTMREFTLAEDMDEQQLVLDVLESTEGMSAMDSYVYANSPYLWIDDELVQFAEVETGRFILCKRGVYGTIPAAHSANSLVRQLKQYFHLPLAKAKSELFYEIARNTAEFYDACGADLFYLDALDGSAVLEGEDYVWYHAMDFIREMFLHMKNDIIFDCCYNPQYTGSWFVRSRYGAIDCSKIAHKECFDAHVNYNNTTAERMGVTPEMGWVNLYLREPDFDRDWQSEVLLEEDLEYLCAKSLATDASMAFLENFYKFKDLPISETYAKILRKYADFRERHVLDEKVRSYLCQPEHPVFLEGDTLYRVHHSKGFIEHSGEGMQVRNPYGEQELSFKLEGLCTAEKYDHPDSVTLCRLDETKPVTELALRYDQMVDSKGKRGLGVWCKGDGSGAIVSISLRNFAGNKMMTGQHFIRADFTGWKYFAFYENQNGSLPTEEWARREVCYRTYSDLQNFYGYYRATLNYDVIDGIDIEVKGSEQICLKDLRLVPHRRPVWENPVIRLGDMCLQIHGIIPAEAILSYKNGKCVVTDAVGNVLSEPTCSGSLRCPSGTHRMTLTNGNGEESVRAKFTVTVRGEALI